MNVWKCLGWEARKPRGPGSIPPPQRFPRGPWEEQVRALGPRPGDRGPPALQETEPVGTGLLEGMVLYD